MEPTRFDSLAKLVGNSTTRRTALALLAGLGLGGLDPAKTEAGRRRKKRKCRPDCKECEVCRRRRRRSKCRPKAAGSRCTNPIGGTCQGGNCTCSGGLTNCGGTCVNTQTDEANCGTCGNVCSQTQTCNLGSCFPQSVCPSAQTSLCDPTEAGVGCGTNCYCGTSTEGNLVCVQNEGFCAAALDNCTSSAQCTAGEACVPVNRCCTPDLPAGSRTCMAQCGAPSIEAVSRGRPGE